MSKVFDLFPAHAGVILIAVIFVLSDPLFPAHAGVILRVLPPLYPPQTVPRTRGGDPCNHLASMCETICSPHTRG